MAEQAIERLYARAERYLAQGQLVAARATLDSMISRDRDHPKTHLTGSRVSLADDRMREATREALAAARNTTGGELDSALEVVDALISVGEVLEARRCLDRLAGAPPQSGAALLRMAVQRQTLGEHRAALGLLELARARGCADSDLHFYRGVQLAFAGRLEEAEDELGERVQREPLSGRAFVELARLRRQTAQRNHLDLLERALRKIAPDSEDHGALEFAYYKELEDLQRYGEAWQALERGNAIMRARFRHVTRSQSGLFGQLTGLCTAEFVGASTFSHQGPRPLFIVGLPRSGSTLLERMLGGHSRVASAGELPDFGRQLNWCTDHRTMQGKQAMETLVRLDYQELGRRYLAQTQWRAGQKPVYIDKQPSNWVLAGLICRALPEARILNLLRDPMDVCFSNYRAYFGNAYAYSYNIPTLAAHHQEYRCMVAQWEEELPDRFLSVGYGDLVREPEPVMRRVLEFCGLDWEPACMDISRNQNSVATLSLAQVRTGIRTDAFGDWRHYSEQLSALASALARPSCAKAS